MDIKIFDFHLPKENIAQFPASPRDTSKLLLVNDNELGHDVFYNIADYFNDGDLLIFNNTKVIAARLFGKRNEAKIEIMLHMQENGNSWRAFAKPAKKLNVGSVVNFTSDFSGEIIEKFDMGEVLIKFNKSDCELFDCINLYGTLPLPPYIERKNGISMEDKEAYQTIYAKKEGAVAAPTAGLHFTNDVLEKLRLKGVNFAEVTLHVGAGTFLPVKVDNISEHKMHKEWGQVSADVVTMIKETRLAGKKIICCGTTSLRIIESVAKNYGEVVEFSGFTDIFITPKFEFKVADMLLTNFHLPKSTLFMLVCAFGGIDNISQAYKKAIENNYRFYSYGDSSLIYRNNN